MKRYILFLLATLLSAAVSGQTAARTDSLAQHPQSEQTASAAYASDPDKLWDQANTAYINNDFPTAISLYETILSSGRQSGKLYYNLANAYFKEQEIGRAILNYNRALRLNPGNEDIRYNLQVAEKMTKDHIDAVPEFFVKTWLSNLRNLLSSTTWAVLSLVFLAAMLGSALFYLLSRRLVRRKIGFYGTATAFLLLVLTLCFAAIDRREAIDRTSAVVLRDAVAVKSSPDQNSTDLFILHEGTKVEISDRLNGWCEITIADGKRAGWSARRSKPSKTGSAPANPKISKNVSRLLQDVTGELSKLPGIGRRTALRLAIHLLRMEPDSVSDMTRSIDRFRRDIKYCKLCNNLSDEEICPICADRERDHTTVCVVEQVADVLSIENTRQYRGLYHVLGGVISPMQGIAPSDLKIDLLIERIAQGTIREVILAISTSVEGETTLFYLLNRLRQYPQVKVTSIARGIGFGDELEYVDELTITHALMNRREIE